MENVRTIILTILLAISPLLALAYEPETAHKGLTSEIIKFYTKYNPDKFSESEIQAIKNGSVREDDNVRPLRHFFDPINNHGLRPETKSLLGVSVGTIIPFPSAKLWAQDTQMQASSNVLNFSAQGFIPYFDHSPDYSWQRAIYEYAWGNRERGLESLGHVLHLAEDMTVPDHVRNDAHMPYLDGITFNIVTERSPYEEYTNRFNELNMDIASDLYNEGKAPNNFTSLTDYFNTVATFTNTHFFSKDTLPSTGLYQLPNFRDKSELIEGGENFFVSIIDGEVNYLASYDTYYNRESGEYIRISTDIIDDNKKVLSSYWSVLSRTAVQNGAGVLDLFFREVEREKATKELYNKNKTPVIEVAKAVVNTTVAVYNYTESKVIAAIDWSQKLIISSYKYTVKKVAIVYDAVIDNPFSNFVTKVTLGTLSTVGGLVANTWQGLSDFSQNINLFEPDLNLLASVPGQISTNFGETYQGDYSLLTVNNSPIIDTPTSYEPTLSDLALMLKIAEESVASLQTSIGSLHSTAVTNTESPRPPTASTISLGNFVSGVGSVPSAFVVVELSESTVEDDFSDVPTTTPPEIVPDDSVISELAIECSPSIGSDACLLPAPTSLRVSVSNISTTTAYYNCDGSLCPLASSTEPFFDIEPITFGNFEIVISEYDENDALTGQGTTTVSVLEKTLRFNEIAWDGTVAESHDEWIEIYNSTSYSISLDGWSIEAETSGPDFSLSGTVLPYEYALLERKEEEVTSATSTMLYGNFGSAFALSNEGENLSLIYDEDTIIDQVLLADGWMYGGGDEKDGIEYVCYKTIGNAESCEWTYIDQTIDILNSTDREGNKIIGTPGSKNTSEYFLNSKQPIMTDVVIEDGETVFACGANYVITPTGKLTVEAGGVLKICDSSSFTVYGSFILSGTDVKRTIITKANDSSYEPAIADGYSTNTVGPINIVAGGKMEAEYATFRGFDDFLFIQDGDIQIKNSTLVASDSIALIYGDSNFVGDTLEWGGCVNDCYGIIAYDESAVELDNFSIVSTDEQVTLLETFESSNGLIKNSNISLPQFGLVSAFNSSEIILENINANTGFAPSGCLVCMYVGASSTISSSILSSTENEDDVIAVFGAKLTVNDVDISGGENSLSVYGVYPDNSATVDFSRGSLKQSANAGLFVVGDNASTSLEGARISENTYGIEKYSNSTLGINNSSIKDNTLSGIYNGGAQSIDAINNWWGSETGPMSADNPEGLGDSIEGIINFTPWLTAEPMF